MKPKLTMKHYAMIAAALVAGVLLFTECASMRIPYRRLPAKAKAFIETYFPAERCVYAERDRDDGRREYEVKLSDGTEIDFHATGDWKKVECEYSFVPAGIVPQTIYRRPRTALSRRTYYRGRAGDGRIQDHDGRRREGGLLLERNLHPRGVRLTPEPIRFRSGPERGAVGRP